MKLIVGSRGSKLALTQTEWVIDQLKRVHSQLEFEIKVISTKGDQIQNVSLDQLGGKGVFVKEIEAALLEGSIHFAVHSMKDMPSEMDGQLIFAPVPVREDPRDVLVTKHPVKSFFDLPEKATIGTGSKRRKYQVLKLRQDLQVVDIRGNIDTRISKMLKNEDLDGIILAAAGINRLGLKSNEEYQIIPLDIERFIPSPTQGILALQLKKENDELLNLFQAIAHIETTIPARVERDFLRTLNGSCHVPLGAYCAIDGEKMTVYGLFGDEEGTHVVTKTIEGKLSDQDRLGSQLAMELLKEVRTC